jgi:hypothetical protein
MRRTRGWIACSWLLLVLGADLLSAADAPNLRLATFECDVTLPLGDVLYSETLQTVEHPLLAKGVVLDDGSHRYVLCAVDWCTLRNATHAAFQDKLAAAAGTQAERVAVHCVHQHTAPTFDAGAERLLAQQENPPPHRNLKSLDEITDRLAQAVRQSLERFQPFDAVGVGQARVERVAAIRRVFTPDGKLLTRWSSCRDESLRAMPEGHVDPLLRTVTLARGQRPLVRLHYYATHPQTYYLDGRASYDFPGMARQRLQEEEGVFQVYFTGCAGDVTVGKYNPGTPEARAELAERLYQGMQAAAAAATRCTPVERIGWRSVPVRLTPRTDDGYDPTQNRVTLADPNAKPADRIRAASRLACYERLQEPILLSCLQIGPARIVHLPGEPLIAYQHFLTGLLPDQFVAVAGYGLATPGYVCTAKAFEEGGYEPSASAIVPESEGILQSALRTLCQATQAESP